MRVRSPGQHRTHQFKLVDQCPVVGDTGSDEDNGVHGAKTPKVHDRLRCGGRRHRAMAVLSFESVTKEKIYVQETFLHTCIEWAGTYFGRMTYGTIHWPVRTADGHLPPGFYDGVFIPISGNHFLERDRFEVQRRSSSPASAEARAQRMQEFSRFVREDGRWFYVDGVVGRAGRPNLKSRL